MYSAVSTAGNGEHEDGTAVNGWSSFCEVQVSSTTHRVPMFDQSTEVETYMGCTHSSNCPLFPKLHASLAAWRTHYCDTESEWMSCARYQRSMLGEAVPVALLPNGKIVGMLAETADDDDMLTAAHGGADGTSADGEPPTAIKPSLWRRLFGKEK